MPRMGAPVRAPGIGQIAVGRPTAMPEMAAVCPYRVTHGRRCWHGILTGDAVER